MESEARYLLNIKKGLVIRTDNAEKRGRGGWVGGGGGGVSALRDISWQELRSIPFFCKIEVLMSEK